MVDAIPKPITEQTQVCGFIVTALRPRMIPLLGPGCRCSLERFGTRKKIETASTSATSASTFMLSRQPIDSTSCRSGAWPKMPPLIPTVCSKPANIAYCAGLNQ